MNDTKSTRISKEERLRRWRLILGGGEADGIGCSLDKDSQTIDNALGKLYGGAGGGSGTQRSAGLGASAPNVARWLGDIRTYFKSDVVRMMQKDAMERLNLQRMLLEPEMLEAVEADVHLVSTIISLSSVIPQRTKETARMVVRKVVDDLMRKLEEPMRAAVTGAIDRAARNTRPRLYEVDWNRTIRRNLKHYQPDYQTIIPETVIGYGHKQRRTMRDIILCVDQSGSMASSVVYSSIFAAVMASLPAVRTSLVVFDTSVVDLTEKLEDPVEVLFGTQLGGGTDINRAVGYCQSLVRQPANTILVLISDLYEGGVAQDLLKRSAQLIASGVNFIVLLALSDEGAPMFDHGLAQQLNDLGAPSFACTPNLFPSLMAAAIRMEDVSTWAARHDIVTSFPSK